MGTISYNLKIKNTHTLEATLRNTVHLIINNLIWPLTYSYGDSYGANDSSFSFCTSFALLVELMVFS
jgi:hypothetical protein